MTINRPKINRPRTTINRTAVTNINRRATTVVNNRTAFRGAGRFRDGYRGLGSYRVSSYHRPWHHHHHRHWYRGSWGGWWWRVPSFWAGFAWGRTYDSFALPTFYNPYYAAVEVPVEVPTYLNYSTPIEVPTEEAETATADEVRAAAMAYFDEAREAFRRGLYTTATSRVERALRFLPNDPSLHEFRALTLFARGRYDEAAAALYSVLAVQPGMNWDSMAALYDDPEVYTGHLRSLERFVQDTPRAAYGHFLLGYHYLVVGQREAAAAEFGAASELSPEDKLSASLYSALTAPVPELPDE